MHPIGRRVRIFLDQNPIASAAASSDDFKADVRSPREICFESIFAKETIYCS